jgi:addiction module HigA family antidote
MAKKADRSIPLTPPGAHLREIMEDAGLTQYRLAKELGVQQTRISRILSGRRAITADTAIRLGRLFGTTAEMWLNLQKNYDLELAEREKGDEITQTITPLARDSEFPHSRQRFR